MNEKIKYCINQDIDNPKFLFHGSPCKLNKLVPKESYDANRNLNNIANAIFLFPSFLKATPYAFKDTIKKNSEWLDWNFEIPNSNIYPLMTMSNVNIAEDMIGYIYVFLKGDSMIKDENSYQYKCYEELYPFGVVEIHYRDFSKYYELKNNTKSI